MGLRFNESPQRHLEKGLTIPSFLLADIGQPLDEIDRHDAFKLLLAPRLGPNFLRAREAQTQRVRDKIVRVNVTLAAIVEDAIKELPGYPYRELLDVRCILVIDLLVAL